MLSAGSSLLCFAYDTCLHTCLLLNKSVLTIIIIAYLITHDKYITQSIQATPKNNTIRHHKYTD